MDTRSIDEALQATLEDGRLSRAERRAFSQMLAETAETSADLDQIQARAFALAEQHLAGTKELAVIHWLEEVVKLLSRRRQSDPDIVSEAWFSPGFACARRLIELLRTSRRAIDICVFTITDDRISDEILRCHSRGLGLRIISDDDKAWDTGSDIVRLREAGVPIAVDGSPAHMHHKFAIFDGATVATGSYNWTRSAANENQENLVVCDHAPLVRRFRDEFERLWDEMAAH